MTRFFFHVATATLGLAATALPACAAPTPNYQALHNTLAAGPLHGTFSGTDMQQTAQCSITINLPERDIGLNGPCSAQQMSGALTVRLRPTQLWAQVTHFISPDTSVSQYWLSRAAWPLAVSPATP